ncbi:anthranilate synthase component I family protein [Cryobacterium sp. MDB1-18-2]|uniref:anthranilate synthase component I family protein n=1 Tax=unclassified Cryobacterium TaxID=2649013 RepID=UPI0010693B1C|nr:MULTISPECIES: anthranilate synthase component I family protein [unclassified Cryobacterium]TFC33466.1 anthranilate synthase component I family protein [Cryobacterium sp. MDB1-18-2]TFC46989.1 anthranilate synthase component I family protein [Cryobacterium sp. MDB1-18-1]
MSASARPRRSPGRGDVERWDLDGWWDPADAFDALYRDSAHAIWLDAGPGAQAGFSYLAGPTERSRFVTASVMDGTVTVTVPGDPLTVPATSTGTVFDFLSTDLATPGGSPGGEGASGFHLGWVGWLGYELGAQTLDVPQPPSRYPDAALLEVDRMLAFDHESRTVTLLARRQPGEPARLAEDWARAVRARRDSSPAARHPLSSAGAVAAVDVAPEQPGSPPRARWRHGSADYAALIERCQAFIAAGDAYQLCLTNEITVDVRPHPVVAYHRLRAGSPSHHGGLLRFGDTALLSASPEQFLTVGTDGSLSSKPIKGTRPRSADPASDAGLRADLAASDKERAENLMIVDLMRNDLGRVAELGTVAVTRLLDVESYAHVHQLVSTVEARLAAGLTGTDAVRSCFPAGSMTGVPKQSAVSLLRGLEDGPRGIYSGAFGYFGRDGAVDLAMVIRSIVLDPAGASIGTGGGITTLSVPAEEVEETRIKAAALLTVLGCGPDLVTGAG